MEQTTRSKKLDRPVDPVSDHALGPADAEFTLVEYGSYDCPTCRAANDVLAGLRDDFGDRLRYVFRHKPIADSDAARRAAELVERAADTEQFWAMHVDLMTRSDVLTEEDLRAVAAEVDRAQETPEDLEASVRRARDRVDADIKSASASGVIVTPTFFINGRRYEGPWDQNSLTDAMVRTPGHRMHSATLDFIRWGPSAGVLLLLATLLAVAITNSPYGPVFSAFWEQHFGFTLGDVGFQLSLLEWVNDGLLTIFFLVVGLEIKREFTVGHLATPSAAALPIAAALGGMMVPALLYALVIPNGPWSLGWGIPMATDTAFAVALIAVLGSRVPVELRVFLTAAAVVDDIGAILVIAVFYSADLQLEYLAAAGVITAALALLNRARVYRISPYLMLGVALWACIHAAGLHATMAGVILAILIPARPPPDLKALMAQANTILSADIRRGGGALRYGPSLPALVALDAVHDRLQSPAARLLRHAGARSSYVVLPVFALANAGVEATASVVGSHTPLMIAIIVGLVIGKPLGMVAASALVVRLGIALKPDAYSWRQLVGAGSLAGIGFTMSLFVASQAFASEDDFTAAKIAVFAASILAAAIGASLLWHASPDTGQQR